MTLALACPLRGLRALLSARPAVGAPVTSPQGEEPSVETNGRNVQFTGLDRRSFREPSTRCSTASGRHREPQLPVKTGGRFARAAAMPSCKSWVASVIG